MKLALNTKKIGLNWKVITSTNFLTKYVKWFYLLLGNHQSTANIKCNSLLGQNLFQI